MPRFLHAVARGLFYPAVVIAITVALTANHHVGSASAATLQRDGVAAAKHREPIAHIALGDKFSKKAKAGKRARSARSARAYRKVVSKRRKSVNKTGRIASGMPAEGIFGGCDFVSDLATCEANLRAIHSAGFNVDVAAVGGSPADMATAASYAQSLGVSIMWEINDPGFWGGAWSGSSAVNDFPAFASACACTGTVGILDYMIQYLSSLPGTYGYYAADDELLTPSEGHGLTQYVNEIKAIDPDHMVMVGSNESQGIRYFATGATIGNEIYPQTTGSVMPYEKNLGTWQSVAQNITQDQNAAQSNGTQSAFILQAFTFGDNLTDGEAVGVCTRNMSQAACANLLPYPSAATQLELRNEVLEHASPRLILWYGFAESYGIGNRWAGLQQAINAPEPAETIASVARAKGARAKAAKARTRVARAKAARANAVRANAARARAVTHT